MHEHPVPPDEYWASLPRHVASGAALFRDPDGGVLLVRPARGDLVWELPGGALEDGEHPWETAQREVNEEVGLTLESPARLLVVDWVRLPGRPALINFVFDGGVLDPQEAARRIRLQEDELSEWRICPPDEWGDLLPDRMVRRVRGCVAAAEHGSTAYLHEGRPS